MTQNHILQIRLPIGTSLVLGVWLVLFSTQSVSQTLRSMSDTALVNTLIQKASAQQRSNVDSCYLLSLQALEIAQAIPYNKGISSIYNQLAAVMMIRGKNDSSLFYCKQSLRYSRSHNDFVNTSYSYILMSYIYQDKGKNDSSLYAIHQALRVSTWAKDSNRLGVIYTALANFYLEYKDYPKSLRYFNQAYALSVKQHNESGAGDALEGIANVYYLIGKYRTALRYYMQLDSISKHLNEPTGRAQNQNNIALCYVDMKDKRSALYYYNLALQSYIKHGLRFEEANVYYNMGQLYYLFNQPDSALYFSMKALGVANEIDDAPKKAACYEQIAQAYAAKGNYTQAYTYHERFTRLTDSLLNIEKVRSIAEMQTKYDTELKSQEIALLLREKEIAKLKAIRSLGINYGLGVALFVLLFIAFVFYNQYKKKQKLNAQLTDEKKKSDDLLLNILPGEIADELKQTGSSEAKLFNHVTVLFSDFVNFTGISSQMSPADLVQEIHKNFTAFDAIMEKHGVIKIKTIGDAYLAVCGLPNEQPDHAQRMVLAALELQSYMKNNPGKFQIRIGINTGPVVAGIVGVKKFAYDIWGDTVNTANRMESSGEAGKVNISQSTYERIKNDPQFRFESRGKVEAKGKGEMEMFFVNRSFSEG